MRSRTELDSHIFRIGPASAKTSPTTAIEAPVSRERTVHFRFPQPKPSGRIVAEFEGVRILVDPLSAQYVEGAQVDYVDSTGLGALVMYYTTLQREGGKIKLLNLTRRSIELLVMTKLATVFEIFDRHLYEKGGITTDLKDRPAVRYDVDVQREEARRGVILSLVASVGSSYLTLRGLDDQLEISKRTLGTRHDARRKR